jgi:hypothetical protein
MTHHNGKIDVADSPERLFKLAAVLDHKVKIIQYDFPFEMTDRLKGILAFARQLRGTDVTANEVVFDTTDDGDYIRLALGIPTDGTTIFVHLSSEVTTP